MVQRVINDGYAPDLTDQEVEIIGRDPFLVSYGLRSPSGASSLPKYPSRGDGVLTENFQMFAIKCRSSGWTVLA
jgi:hypothetical protein